MEHEILSSGNKALKINLNPAIFGTIAEIGGGQEVAREFFRAGGASKTIAKSISAYNKTFSDSIYKSKSERYVSEVRLKKMLEVEYSELSKLLDNIRGKTSTFFAFANTVETINYKKDNKGHGWLGIRFQLTSQSKPNDVIIHAILHENDTMLQQKTLSVLGINLIFASFYLHNNIDEFLISLLDNLSDDRLEINMISVSGSAFTTLDNRLLSVKLVKFGLTPVSMFDRYGEVQQPGDMVYNKNVMLLRGSFRPITYIEIDMLKSGFATFKKDVDFEDDTSVVLCEMTLNNLLDKGEFHEKDFLDRVDLLNGMGQNVMISNFKEFYRLSAYFSQFNINNLRMIMGADILKKVIDEKYYENLRGGILEAFGRLFGKHVKLYIYPFKHKANEPYNTSLNIEVQSHLKALIDYLKYNEKIIDINSKKFSSLIYSNRKISEMIKNNDVNWRKMVPKYISYNIMKKGLFGYKN
ncbi:MAG: hypothetical protein A2X08_14325 [Bacteroidetes bacterium GWA2_32_17]|nr:MAG: hypothetical protein A2X08_14325 [Bacteroidetes bacterium GWA2_32_17]